MAWGEVIRLGRYELLVKLRSGVYITTSTALNGDVRWDR